MGPISSLALSSPSRPSPPFQPSLMERNRYFAPRSMKPLPWTAQQDRRRSSTPRSNFPAKCGRTNFSQTSKASNETSAESPNQEKNSPRTIDIDLLYCDDIALSEPDLTIPHPRIARRRFVLRPLADIRPKLILPHFARNVEELLANLQSDESVEVYCNVIY